MDEEGIELSAISRAPARQGQLLEADFGPTDDQTRSIPPADTGREAWLFLAACFTVEALVWGFPYCFGLFQEYYSTHEPFASQGSTAVIGTCAMGIIYLGAPAVFGTLRKWPKLRRPFVFAGLPISCIALAASSFAQNVTHLILTQGILYAIGGAMTYCPTILFVDEWFIKRKGLAFGIMWAGTGVAGTAIPLVMIWLLEAYGFRTALRAWCLSLFILMGPLLYWVKPRLPVSQSEREHSNGKLFDMSFLLSKRFLIHEVGNVLEAFGFFLPAIYLPSYTQQTFGTSHIASALTVICVNIASVFGCVFMGSLIDRFDVTTCIMISTLGTTIGVFLFWGLSTSLPVLYIFCVLYGLFAGSFSSAWTGIVRDVQSKAKNADIGMVFAFLAFGRGVGNVVSGPLSDALIKGKPWLGEAAMAYGTGYGPLITFTGVSALLGGCSFFARRVGFI